MTRNGGDKPRPTIGFVGAGRAGAALAVALHEAGHAVVAVHSRGPSGASLAGRVGAEVVPTAVAAARAADVCFLTVPDAAISGMAATIAAGGARLGGHGLVHCSAIRGREALAAAAQTGATLGAFHPLQALTGPESASLIAGSVIALDADAPLLATLERLVADLGAVALALRPGARPLYHAAAVLAGNAPLVLLAAAAGLLEDAGLNREAAERGLAGLLAGAAANAGRLGVRAALTGPVVRGDAATVAGHLAALGEHPVAEALYRSLTAETLRLAGLEGREAIAALLTHGSDTPPVQQDRAERASDAA